MSKKFIPNGDMDFVVMAEAFAGNIAKEPARYEVSQEESDALGAAVKKFRAALSKARQPAQRSTIATQEKEIARGEAEEHIRRLAHVIRAKKSINAMAKRLLMLRERPAKMAPQLCPQEPPQMRFVRALHEGNGATPMHELEFRALDGAGARPAGAARLELFVGLIPPDEPVPKHPAYVSALRPWYWRSFTRSPIVLVPPMARVPMRVVYWGRWADTTGNVGPFSSTVAGWVEGGTHHNLPGAIGLSFSGRDRNAAPPLIEDATSTPQQTKYTVAILEAHVQSFAPNLVPSRELSSPEEKQTPQLEGPEEEAA